MWGKPLRKKGGGYDTSALYAIIFIKRYPFLPDFRGGILHIYLLHVRGRSVERLFLIGQHQKIKREEDISPVIFNQ